MLVLETYIQSFLDISDQYTTTFGHLSDEMLNRKHNESVWSIAQIMDHIIVINESYYPIFENVKANRNTVPWTGSVPFLPAMFGNMIEKSLRPESKHKTKTFPIWEPAQSNISGIIARFREHHLELTRELREMKNWFNKGIIISSPANKFVVYPLDQAVPIMYVHEQRHFKQAQESV